MDTSIHTKPECEKNKLEYINKVKSNSLLEERKNEEEDK